MNEELLSKIDYLEKIVDNLKEQIKLKDEKYKTIVESYSLLEMFYNRMVDRIAVFTKE